MANIKSEYLSTKQIQIFKCSKFKTVKQNNRVIAIPPMRERRFVIASEARQSHSTDRHVATLLAMTTGRDAPRDDNRRRKNLVPIIRDGFLAMTTRLEHLIFEFGYCLVFRY